MSYSPCSYEQLNPVKPFVFSTVDKQNAANMVYTNMSTMNGQQPMAKKQFKTDRERMQYLLGQRARDATCCVGYPNGRCTT